MLIDTQKTACFPASMMKLRWAVLPLLMSHLPSVARSQPTTTHGTVNVVLANSNGAVVVADSRLSSDGRIVGEGQKLFQLDQKTICVIAGFYSDSGPVTSQGVAPFRMSVPYLMKLYDIRSSRFSTLTIDQKFQIMADLFNFFLAFVAASREADLSRLPLSSSELTLIGYEGDQIVLRYATLAPRLTQGRVEYEMLDERRVVVHEAMISHLAGFTDQGTQILAKWKEESNSRSTILRAYSEAMRKDQGASIALGNLAYLAESIERETSKVYPSVVGGTVEEATLAGGVVATYQPGFLPTADSPPRGVVRISGGKSSRSGHAAVVINPPGIALLEGFESSDENFEMNNIIVVHSLFTHDLLRYSGAPRSLFSSTNKLHGCQLEVSKSEDLNSPFIKDLAIHYPDLVKQARIHQH